jgi:hypothetical protein
MNPIANININPKTCWVFNTIFYGCKKMPISLLYPSGMHTSWARLETREEEKYVPKTTYKSESKTVIRKRPEIIRKRWKKV